MGFQMDSVRIEEFLGMNIIRRFGMDNPREYQLIKLQNYSPSKARSDTYKGLIQWNAARLVYMGSFNRLNLSVSGAPVPLACFMRPEKWRDLTAHMTSDQLDRVIGHLDQYADIQLNWEDHGTYWGMRFV